MDKIFDKFINWCTTAGGNILEAILLVYIGFVIVKMITKRLEKIKLLNKMDKSVSTFLLSFLNISCKVIILLSAATILGFPTTSVVTIVGTFSVAIGLAMQGGLANIVGGLTILMFKPFKVGDYILITGVEGTVQSISIFHTILATADNKQITIPNGTAANTMIQNYSIYDARRVDLLFTVPAKNDVEKVKKIINDVVTKEKLVLQDKEITIRLMEQSDTSIKFVTRIWTKSSNYWEVYWTMQERIKEAFEKNKVN